MKPVILIDVDGVLIQWQSNLPFFAAEHNIPTDRILNMVVDEKFRSMSELFGCDAELANKLMLKYNSSKWIRGLKAYDDALIAINRMKQKYDFVAITALGKSADCCLNRIANLNILFPSAFIDVMTVDFNESKIPRYLDAKMKYKDRIVCFIDDLAKNLEDCRSVIPDIKLFHMLRGPRDKATEDCKEITSLFDLESLLEKPESSDNFDELLTESSQYPSKVMECVEGLRLWK